MMFHKKGGGSAYCRRCRKSANVVDNVSKKWIEQQYKFIN